MRKGLQSGILLAAIIFLQRMILDMRMLVCLAKLPYVQACPLCHKIKSNAEAVLVKSTLK